MSKPLKKSTKVLLAVVIVTALLAICFGSVALYAKKEFEKERSWLPKVPYPQHESVRELPKDIHGAYEYAMELYNAALHAERVEGSWHTDVDLSGEMTLPFSPADNEIVSMIRDGAAGRIQALYPSVSSVLMTEEKAEDLPVIALKESDIIEYPYDEQNIFNRKGEYKSDKYEIVFKVSPSFEKTDEIRHSSVFHGICDLLKDAVTFTEEDVDLQVKTVEIRFVIDRLTDHLLSVDVSRSYDVTARVTLTDAYKSLLADSESGKATVGLPYKATEHITFMWYGLRYTEDYLETKPNDIIMLPLDIRVNGAAVQGEDFKIEFSGYDPDVLEIDSEAMMTVKKTTDGSDTEGITVTARLLFRDKDDPEKYNLYPDCEDVITVYITKLDKATAGVRFYKDSFTATLGETAALPVEIRVPINETAESKREEEYTLDFSFSEPDVLHVEVDGKDLYVTALKPAADTPVTLTVIMKCGGHTYTDEIPVTILAETEATNNG